MLMMMTEPVQYPIMSSKSTQCDKLERSDDDETLEVLIC